MVHSGGAGCMSLLRSQLGQEIATKGIERGGEEAPK